MIHPPAVLALVTSIALLGTGVGSVSAGQEAAPAPLMLPRIAIEDADPSIAGSPGSLPFPLAVRIVSERGVPGANDARLERLLERGMPVWLALPPPSDVTQTDEWRTAVRACLERYGRVLTVLELLVADENAAVVTFAAQLASTEVRAAAGATRVALGGARMADTSRREQVYTAALAPYIDLLAVPDGEVDAAADWLGRVDPTAAILATTAIGRQGAGIVSDLATAVLRFSATKVRLFSVHNHEALPGALRSAAPAMALLGDSIQALTDESVDLRLTRGGADLAAALAHRVLFDSRTFATYFAYWGGTGGPVDLALRLALDGSPVAHDFVARTEWPVRGSRDAATSMMQVSLPVTNGPMLVDFNRGAAPAAGETSQVLGQSPLTVGEIIARHQAEDRRQLAKLRNYIAQARVEQHFRPSLTDPGYDIVTENRYFVSGSEVEWEELSFSVNGSRWGSDRPPVPLIQPEKVLSLPLQLRFDEGYRYRLDGSERVEGHDCYVVQFEPTREDPALYRGTIWIDRQSFSRIRVRAVRSGLTGLVVSNDEMIDYAPVLVDGQPVYLLHQLTARQTVLIAGRNLLLERQVTFVDLRPNDPDFEALRAAARRSDRVMFRETADGLRYYVKQGDVRVVSDRLTQGVKAMAMGVTLDPSYAFPLPIFGINYIDFDFGGPDTQLALLFGGVLAAGNVQRTKLGRTPLDASLDFFGIAVPSSDRFYAPDGERESERVLTWPLSTGVNLGWQYSAFQKATLQYQFRYDAYLGDTTTTDDFTVPSSTVTNGIGAAWEHRQGGYSLVLNAAWYRRQRWENWGPAEAPEAIKPTYAKYSANLSRDFYFKIFHKIHLNAGWFGGRHLDRFSKYQFGMFDDTRVHGVPAAGIRYEDLAMARGSYSLNIFEQYRVDLFVERAWGRDRSVDDRWQAIQGIGLALNFRAPKNTILRADVGKSFLPPSQSHIGSYTLQVLILKPLR